MNKVIPNSFIDKLSFDKKFNRFVSYVVHRNELYSLQKSLFNVKNNEIITHQTFFSLALSTINHKKEKIALTYFQEAYKKAYFQSSKDKTLFLIYLLTKDKSYLQRVSKSWDNNMYSLYAKELLDISIDNIIYDLEIVNTKTTYNILDQFEWIKVLEDTKKNFDEKKLEKYRNLFSDDSTLGHYAFVLERYSKYKKQYFIKPFKEIMQNYNINRQVLMYAISRQESRFIPFSVSFATAQGVMQIMPFLSEKIAKDLNELYNIYEQFIAKTNIKYANKHFDTLSKKFHNPLYIAYAYNGGPVYTRKQFKRGLLNIKIDLNLL